jgi:hypothetical protein
MISNNLSGFWADIETLFSAISSFLIASARKHKDISISNQRKIIYGNIAKVISFVGLGINMTNVLQNSKLNLTQQILEIAAHIVAWYGAGALVTAMAGPLGVLGGVLLSILVCMFVTWLLEQAIIAIETYANSRQKRKIYI